MPELGMLLWRSPLGTMGLCIMTNLRVQQDLTCSSQAMTKSGKGRFGRACTASPLFESNRRSSGSGSWH